MASKPTRLKPELNYHRNFYEECLGRLEEYDRQRIQEVADLDLEDGDTRLTLPLALRAGDILRVGESLVIVHKNWRRLSVIMSIDWG